MAESFRKGEKVEWTNTNTGITRQGVVFGASGSKAVNVTVGDKVYRVSREKLRRI